MKLYLIQKSDGVNLETIAFTKNKSKAKKIIKNLEDRFIYSYSIEEVDIEKKLTKLFNDLCH